LTNSNKFSTFFCQNQQQSNFPLLKQVPWFNDNQVIEMIYSSAVQVIAPWEKSLFFLDRSATCDRSGI